MVTLSRLELVVTKCEGYLTELTRFVNYINKTPIIININLLNIKLLHMQSNIKKKKDK